MPKQYKEIFRGKTARTLELLREEQEPKTPLEILIEEDEFDITRKRHKHFIKEIRRTLKSLTLRQRQCIRLYFIKNKKQVEIAQILGIRQNVVTAHLAKAKRKLKKLLKERR